MPANGLRLAASLGCLLAVTGCYSSDYSNFKSYGESESVKTAPEAAAVPTMAELPDDVTGESTSNPAAPSSPASMSAAGKFPEDAQAPANSVEPGELSTAAVTPVRPETKASGLRSDLLALPAETAVTNSGSEAVSAVDQLSREGAATAGGDSMDKPAASLLREVKVLIPEKQFSAEGKDHALRVSYDDLDLLKVLNMDPVTDQCVELMPDWLKQLNGQKVRIRGFMYPTFEASGITEFVLARDNQICCFGRNPKVYDLIGIKMAPGKTTHYIPNRPFDVTGTFVIEKASAEGEIFGLYWIRDAVINDR